METLISNIECFRSNQALSLTNSTRVLFGRESIASSATKERLCASMSWPCPSSKLAVPRPDAVVVTSEPPCDPPLGVGHMRLGSVAESQRGFHRPGASTEPMPWPPQHLSSTLRALATAFRDSTVGLCLSSVGHRPIARPSIRATHCLGWLCSCLYVFRLPGRERVGVWQVLTGNSQQSADDASNFWRATGD